MSKPTCRSVLLDYINTHEGYTKKVDLYRVAEDWSPETVGRDLRYLEEEGKIKVAHYDGKYSKNLCKYARADYQEAKPKVIIKEINGRATAVME